MHESYRYTRAFTQLSWRFGSSHTYADCTRNNTKIYWAEQKRNMFLKIKPELCHHHHQASGIRHHYTVAHPFTHTRTVERKPNKNVFNGIMDQAMSTPLYCVQLRTIVPDNCLEMCTPASNSQQSLEHRAPRTRFGIFTGKCVTWRCDAFAAGDSFYQLRVIFVRPIFLCMCRMRRWEANSSLLLFFVSFFSSFICCLECSYATIHDLRSICWIRRVIRFQVAKSRDEHTHTRNFINKRNLILLFRSVRWAISSSLVSTVEARTRHELNNNKINVSSTKLIIWCK